MTNESTPAVLGLSEGLGPLVACPMCGAEQGYTLSEGDTYRWWDVHCVGCGRLVETCASDRRTVLGTYLPKRWPAADEAWNDAGRRAHDARAALRTLVAALDSGHSMTIADAWMAAEDALRA